MSNLSQFISVGGSNYPLDIPISIASRNGPSSGNTTPSTFVDGDNQTWYTNVPTSPFPYTSEWDFLSDEWTTPHLPMTGPESGGTWIPYDTQMNIACDTANNIYMTSTYDGTYSGGYNYYYSTNGGTTWNQGVFPTTATNSTIFRQVNFVNGIFIVNSQSTGTANNIAYSTDAVNWTTVSSPANITVYDFIGDGVSTIVGVGSSTTHMVSVDNGQTWTSQTLSGFTPNYLGAMAGQGGMCYAPSAGLFIISGSGTNMYATSPTGLSGSWTFRTNVTTNLPYGKYGNFWITASPTRLVATARSGVYASSTDGITWSNFGILPGFPNTGSRPDQNYWDGTRFVVRWNRWIWYSTDGINWNRGKSVGGTTLITPQSNGILFVAPLWTTSTRTLLFKVSDVTLTTKQYVISPILHSSEFTSVSSIRIK